MDNILPNTPIEDPLALEEYSQIPLRWWNMKTTAEHLGVSERTVRRYKADDLLDYKYSTVKGHRRVYFTNRSVIALKDAIRDEDVPKSFNIEYDIEEFTEEEQAKLNEIISLFFQLMG